VAVWQRFSALVALVAFASGCAATFDASSPAGAARASNRFGFDLYAKVAEENDNLLCSPASASIALAMAAAGARGKTLEEMAQVLHIDQEKLDAAHASFGSLLAELNGRNGQAGLELRVADQLWGHDDVDFESDFVALLRDRYRAPLELMDFVDGTEAARSKINRWAAEQTRGRIQDILPQGAVHRETRLVITNAVYFKGAWVSQFTPDFTRSRPFRTAEGEVTAEMMAQLSTFRHAKVSGASVVELPYKGRLAMVVILPDEPDGLDETERRLAASYDDWLAALSMKRVDLWLPRWKYTSTLSLGPMLKSMGMNTAFDTRADFTGIAPRKRNDPPIGIDQVLQKTFIEVDEVGTEAAAVTAVTMTHKSVSAHPEPEPEVFHADHPFVYVLRDTVTGVVLFAGRVLDPATG
jgi:serpin B